MFGFKSGRLNPNQSLHSHRLFTELWPRDRLGPGARDPLLQCLHLDKCLPETRYKETAREENCACIAGANYRQRDTETKKPTVTSEELGAKAGYFACSLHVARGGEAT